MAKFVKVILFLLLTVAFHSIAGNVSTAKVVDEQERAITYAMRQHGEISAPDLPGKPVAELNNLQSHQISVTRIQRVQLGEYFFSLKNKILTSVYLEVEMEFAGRLKKIRIKLIMIGICLIFLGGYSLIQEWKDQKKNTTKKLINYKKCNV